MGNIALMMIAAGLVIFLTAELVSKRSGRGNPRREIQLTQIAATTVNDQAGRQTTVLYALAASGSVWVSTDEDKWRRISPPTVARQTL